MAKAVMDNYPSISGENRRKVTQITIKDCKEEPLITPSYGIQEGDIIEFLDKPEDMVICIQPVRENSDFVNTYIGVMKNNRPGWITLASLCRVDRYQRACCALSEELYRFDIQDRIRFLAGKTIKCTGYKNVEINKYDFLNNKRTNEIIEKKLPVIEFVNTDEISF